MNLHDDIQAFKSAINTASDHLGILPVFIEKDYWITLVLKRLADSEYKNIVVFKGGTSLSKGYKMIQRFSEDIDIAIIDADLIVGNQLKILIRDVEKAISKDLTEVIIPEVTSKGSRFRKTVFSYPTNWDSRFSMNTSDKLIIEVNSFANPLPFVDQEISSLIYDYLLIQNRQDLVLKYALEPFTLKILDKNTTLIEKVASLIRFSYAKDPASILSKKIRHFYDLHYLLQDTDCQKYIRTDQFLDDFQRVIVHDHVVFDDPKGWKDKILSESPLISEFDVLWSKLKNSYKSELGTLAFAPIPNEKLICESFKKILSVLDSLNLH